VVGAQDDRPYGHYSKVYAQFDAQLYAEIRRDAFDEDIGQSGWSRTEEFRRFLAWLELTSSDRVLDVGCGSGGPVIYLACESGCLAVGIDADAEAVAHGAKLAARKGLEGRVEFAQVDANEPLPWAEASFDAVVCLDAITHLPDRRRALADWARILRPAGRLLFTDSATVTGLISDAEVAARSRLGICVFAPLGEDTRLIHESGLELRTSEDVTENLAVVAGRRWRARAARAEALRQIEGEARYEAHQEVLRIAERLAYERRLSRYVYLAVRPSV